MFKKLTKFFGKLCFFWEEPFSNLKHQLLLLEHHRPPRALFFEQHLLLFPKVEPFLFSWKKKNPREQGRYSYYQKKTLQCKPKKRHRLWCFLKLKKAAWDTKALFFVVERASRQNTKKRNPIKTTSKLFIFWNVKF